MLNQPQAVCPVFGELVLPSHDMSDVQFTASPSVDLISFPVHIKQEPPLL